MVNSRVCVCIGNHSYEQALDIAKKYNFYEIRADLIAFPKRKINDLITINKNAILTMREPQRNISDEKKYHIQAALKAGIRFVDIECEFAESTFLKTIPKEKIVLSYHNFQTTPDFSTLQNIYDKMNQYNPAVCKIVTTIDNKTDLIAITKLYEKSTRLVAFGMGEKGRISRLLALSLGALFTYAIPNENEETAAGQFTVSVIRKFYKEYLNNEL